MALVKFNKSATKADATGSSMNKDTLYFPTDEQSIYLGGKRVGGDSVSKAANADHATNAGHANTADSATTAGSATSAETAGTAGKVGHALSLQLNGGSTKNFDGSAAVTFNVTPSGIGAAAEIHNHDSVYSKLGHTHTPSEVGAAPAIHNHDSVYSKLGHTHDISIIENAGDAAKRGVDTYISNAPSSSNLPTSSAVKDYVDSQIKNYTSAFRYAGNLVKKSNGAWQINDIPSDISGNVGNIYMDFDTFVGNGEDDSLLKTGFTFYVMVNGTFDGDQVEPGDMITCVGLYNGESEWAPSYKVVNGNITVTETVDNSTKVPTSKAVKSAIDTAITTKINDLDKTLSATSGKAITGITQTNGLITSITEAALNNYTHPSHTATTGVPTANAAPGFGGTFQVNQISSDSQGHVISSTPRTITIPQTLASENDRGLMSPTQFRNLNDVLDALTWK